MSNKETITIEVKTDISDFIKKIQELTDEAISAISCINSTISKTSKAYLELGDIGKFLKETNSMIGKFSKEMNKAEKKGIHGFEKIKKVIIGTTKNTKLATVASEAFKFALNPVGLTLIAGGVIGIAMAFGNLFRKENETIKTSQKNLEAIKAQRQEYQEMQKASEDAISASMTQVDLAQKYGKELIGLVENNDLVAGSQDRINFLVERLNELLPNAGFHYDEVSGKIVDMNGEVVDLEKSLEDLIQTQKAQAYLDAYQDDYAEALKNKKNLMQEQIELYEQIKEKESMVNDYQNEAIRLKKLYGEESEEYAKGMNEFFAEKGMTAKDFEMMKFEINALNQEYEEGQAMLKSYNDTIADFEAMQEAIFNQDWDRVNQIMNGMGEFVLFDENKGIEQVDTLQAQVDELQKIKDTLESMKADNQTIDEDYLESINEQLDASKEQLEAATEFFSEEEIKRYRENGLASGEEYKNGILSKLDEMNIEMGTKATESGNTIIQNIIDSIQSKTVPPVYVDVKYRYVNSLENLSEVPMGASYDDFIDEGLQFTPFSSGTSGFMAQARETIRSVQSRIARNIVSIPVIENRVLASEGKKVEVQQNNVFNVPVQKPSDVTRAIERMNRELARKL